MPPPPVEVPKKIPTLVSKSADTAEEVGRLEGSGENATTEDLRLAAALRSKKNDDSMLYLGIIN